MTKSKFQHSSCPGDVAANLLKFALKSAHEYVGDLNYFQRRLAQAKVKADINTLSQALDLLVRGNNCKVVTLTNSVEYRILRSRPY